MKNIFVLGLLVCFSMNTPTEKLKGDLITFDLLPPFYFHYEAFDYPTPRWRLGYIKEISEKGKLGVEIGFGHASISSVKKGNLLNTGEHYTLVEIRPQYYFILNPKKKANFYTSIELFYIYHYEKFYNEEFFTEDNNYLKFDEADYHRQKFGIIGKLRWFWSLSKRIGLNFYMGGGIKFRHNNYSNFIGLANEDYDEEHFSPYYRKEGLKFNAEFSLGLKLFYRMKKKMLD